MEIWKDIKDYEGMYQVSNKGRVRSLDRVVNYKGKNQHREFTTLKTFKGEIKKLTINQHGYYQIVLYKNGKKKNELVHRLVAQAFIPNPENKPTVNHIDGNRLNDNLNNLEWATCKEQQDHAINVLGFRPKIGTKCRNTRIEQQKRKVRRSDGTIFNSIKEASMGDDLVRRHISDVCKGKRQHAGGYSWEYV